MQVAQIKKFTKRNIKRMSNSGFDFNMLIILIFMLAFGLIMVYSASSYVAVRDFKSQSYFFKRQLIFDFIGLVIMTVVIFIPLKLYNLIWWERYLFYALAFLLPILTIPFGKESHGATRWIELGPVSFQPAEISKLLMILFMASWLASIKNKIDTWLFFGISIGAIIPIFGIIYGLTDNLSSALIIAMICAVMIFVASSDYKKYFVFVVVVVILAAAIIIYSEKTGSSKESSFRLARIYTWLHPGTSSDTTAHQTIQGLYAIGSGGAWGKGLGQSVQKISTLPEPQNDMIFAIICEELGIVGAIALIIMYALLLSRMFLIARDTKNRFNFLVVVGVMSHLGIQAILNIAVATNSMPNTGVSLPFISYGGSSAVFLLIEVGLVFAINRYNNNDSRREAKRESQRGERG